MDSIQEWHQQRGFRRGLVLRELNRPLFDIEGGDDVEMLPPTELDQRECYFLYYELLANGELKQQIFCRGTTLTADVATCLNSRLVLDDELGSRLHAGFLGHANRLVRDVEPLLAPLTNHRATIELCGHSLGGAVACIAALKLRKRGYNVVRVTSVASHRFCNHEAAEALAPLLPPESLRIEDDLDAVPYLPPFESNLGDKPWFVSRRGDQKDAYFVSSDVCRESKWADSALINWRMPESAACIDKVHRVPSYVCNLLSLTREVRDVKPLIENDCRKESLTNDISATPR